MIPRLPMLTEEGKDILRRIAEGFEASAADRAAWGIVLLAIIVAAVVSYAFYLARRERRKRVAVEDEARAQFLLYAARKGLAPEDGDRVMALAAAHGVEPPHRLLVDVDVFDRMAQREMGRLEARGVAGEAFIREARELDRLKRLLHMGDVSVLDLLRDTRDLATNTDLRLRGGSGYLVATTVVAVDLDGLVVSHPENRAFAEGDVVEVSLSRGGVSYAFRAPIVRTREDPPLLVLGHTREIRSAEIRKAAARISIPVTIKKVRRDEPLSGPEAQVVHAGVAARLVALTDQDCVVRSRFPLRPADHVTFDIGLGADLDVRDLIGRVVRVQEEKDGCAAEVRFVGITEEKRHRIEYAVVHRDRWEAPGEGS